MYSEEQVLQKVSKKKQKQMLILTISICSFLIVVLIVCMYFYSDSQPLIKYPQYSLSENSWTTNDITITITNDSNKIQSYSFDGGVTWQTNNTYTVSENGQVTIQVMDVKNKLSNKTIVPVNWIDRTPPELVFSSSVEVQMGTNFSVRTGVQASDKESGIKDNFTAVPNTIDTSKEGEYQVTYSVFDQAGNFIEKTRKIVVLDRKGRTYYRYRDGVVENYQCEPYLCRCVASSTAVSTGTCPTGYILNENGECCNTCYKTCTRIIWGEWSEWDQREVKATLTREVETMIKED